MWTSADYDEILGEFANTKDYKVLNAEEGIVSYTREMKQSDDTVKIRYKWTGTLPFSTDISFQATASSNVEERRGWDKQFYDFKILDVVKSESTGLENIVAWESTTWPWPMSNRDWIVWTCHFREKLDVGNQFLTLSRKCDHEKDPKDTSNVRCDLHLWAILLKPKIVVDRPYTEYQIITQFDANGWVPQYIMDWGVKSFPKEYDECLKKGSEIFKGKEIKIEDYVLAGLNEYKRVDKVELKLD